MSVPSVMIVDDSGLIQDFEDYCEMMDGVHACIDGLPLTDNRTDAWKFGYEQAYHQLESITGMGGMDELQRN